VHTENSHKYDLSSATRMLLASNWRPLQHFTDSACRFMVVLAQADGAAGTA
jgi:L-histidine Nalpha-methyltransferase